MSFGGGTYVTQNMVLPGAYINFVSTERASSAVGERGKGAIGMALSWGPRYAYITKDNVMDKCRSLFGYDYSSSEMKDIREFFKHGNELLVFKLNNNGEIAECTYAKAKQSGLRGNHITLEITKNVDYTAMYDFNIYLDSELVETQSAASMSSLAISNYVTWIKSSEIETGIYKLSGGTNGSILGKDVNEFCSCIDKYDLNAVTLLASDEDYQNVMIEYTKRRRDEDGVKFQLITYRMDADYEGVINIYDQPSNGDDEELLPWVCGAVAGCQINESLTNQKYDGEFSIIPVASAATEKSLINNGYFIFTKVDDEVRVLRDINSLTTFTQSKSEVFQNNQTVRVCDQIAKDVSSVFVDSYMGKVPNDKTGRDSFWSDLVKYHEELQNLRAIEDFSEDDVSVSPGDEKTSVIVSETITPVNSMEKLYMCVYVK